MRIISVIKTENDTGTINDAMSFGIFEEQLSGDVIEEAEKKFLELCKADGIENEIAEQWIEDGYCPTDNYVISIVWTDINEG